MTDKANLARVARHLLDLFYQIYCRDTTVRRYGIYPWNLTEESGISFADGGEALSTVYLMWRYGWISIASPKTRKRVTPFCRIQLTLAGIREAQSHHLKALTRKPRDGSYTATAENINRGTIEDFHN